MTTDLIVPTILYVINAPFFWASMGMTTAIAMFVGAMIYDGQLNQVRKGLLSVGSYIVMLLWMTLSRVIDMINKNPEKVSEMTFAGTLTIFFISLAWLLGVFLGVATFNRRYHGEHVR